MSNPELVFSDLEGPITTMDGAYEAWKTYVRNSVFEDGYYPYDDEWITEGRPGIRPGEIFQPGDALTPVVAHFAARGITGIEIVEVAENAGFIPHIKESVERMQLTDCCVCIVTSSFRPFAEFIAGELGIAESNVSSTPYPVDHRMRLNNTESVLVNEVESAIQAIDADDQGARNAIIDDFIHRQMPFHPTLAHILKTVVVVGGDRKTQAIQAIASMHEKTLADVAFIGDGITDFRTLKAVTRAGGLAVAFNANRWALPRATVSIATTDARDVAMLIEAWRQDGMKQLEQRARAMEEDNVDGHRFIHWLLGRTLTDIEANILPTHEEYRRIIKGKVVGSFG